MRILNHLDDVGASPGSVEAWRALRGAGVVRSASVMVPCPYYPMARDDWLQAGPLDVGVHITLTSEWDAYRWGPITGAGGGLKNADGYFHHGPAAVVAQADRAAVADEMAAQIERVYEDGLTPTHLDAHMGTALLEPFVWDFIALGEKHGLPALSCLELGSLAGQLGLKGFDPGYIAEVASECSRLGWPVFDRFLIGFCPDDREMDDHLTALLAAEREGLIYYALHADTGEGYAHFAPHQARPRIQELALFRKPDARDFFDRAGAEIVGWADLVP